VGQQKPIKLCELSLLSTRKKRHALSGTQVQTSSRCMFLKIHIYGDKCILHSFCYQVFIIISYIRVAIIVIVFIYTGMYTYLCIFLFLFQREMISI